MKFLRHVLFCLSDVLLQRYDPANYGLILEKKFFSCTCLKLFLTAFTAARGGEGGRKLPYALSD